MWRRLVDTPQTADLNVGNGGAGRLEFTANSSAAWLTVSATTGVAPATLTPDGRSCPAFRVGAWKMPS